MKFYLLVLFFISNVLQAQDNLVGDSEFSQFTGHSFDQLTYWQKLNIDTDPDMYIEQSDKNLGIALTKNKNGKVKNNDGKKGSCIGIFAYNAILKNQGLESREYVYTKLISPTIKAESYVINLDISFGENGKNKSTTNHNFDEGLEIGLFTELPEQNIKSEIPIKKGNYKIIKVNNNPKIGSEEWIRISIEFESEEEYKYLVIGKFYEIKDINKEEIKLYYFIDNVILNKNTKNIIKKEKKDVSKKNNEKEITTKKEKKIASKSKNELIDSIPLLLSISQKVEIDTTITSRNDSVFLKKIVINPIFKKNIPSGFKTVITFRNKESVYISDTLAFENNCFRIENFALLPEKYLISFSNINERYPFFIHPIFIHPNALYSIKNVSCNIINDDYNADSLNANTKAIELTIETNQKLRSNIRSRFYINYSLDSLMSGDRVLLGSEVLSLDKNKHNVYINYEQGKKIREGEWLLEIESDGNLIVPYLDSVSVVDEDNIVIKSLRVKLKSTKIVAGRTFKYDLIEFTAEFGNKNIVDEIFLVKYIINNIPHEYTFRVENNNRFTFTRPLNNSIKMNQKVKGSATIRSVGINSNTVEVDITE